MRFFLNLVVLCVSLSWAASDPVIVIPGLQNSILQVQLDEDFNSPNAQCDTETSLIGFPNATLFTPIFVDCFQSYFKLVPRSQCRRPRWSLGLRHRRNFAEQPDGVTVDTVDFGGVSGTAGGIAQFVPALQALGLNVKTAPYDFRLGLRDLHNRGYFDDLELLIKKAYQDNNEAKSTLVCYSYGCRISLEFLKTQGFWFRRKYIKGLVALAPVFAGSTASLPAYISGTPPDEALPTDFIRDSQTSFTSLIYNLPQLAKGAWSKDEVLVETPSRKYTAADVEDLLEDLGLTNALSFYKFNKRAARPSRFFDAPRVPTYVFYGLIDSSTPEKFTYAADFQKDQVSPPFINAELDAGDLVVNERSLTYGKKEWKFCHRNIPLNYTARPGLNHFTILADPAVFERIVQIASSD